MGVDVTRNMGKYMGQQSWRKDDHWDNFGTIPHGGRRDLMSGSPSWTAAYLRLVRMILADATRDLNTLNNNTHLHPSAALLYAFLVSDWVAPSASPKWAGSRTQPHDVILPMGDRPSEKT